ncbi:MAG: type II secretion system F family protein [Acetobacteraceae bacterium]
MSPVFAQLVLGAACVLGAAALGVSAIVHEQNQRRRFRERLALVAAPYARVNPLTVMGRWSAGRSEPVERMIAAAAGLFAYDPARAEHYPLRWWLVLAITLLAARAVAALVSIFAGSWSLLALPLAWVMFSRFVFTWSEQRRRNALYAQFPDALAMIVRAVRVGIPLGEGIRTVAREAAAPTKVEFGLLYDRVAIGMTLEDALREMATRNKLQEYRFFTTALALQSQTGGGLSEALEGLADVMRRRLALKARGNALAAEAKTSIIILASLPFVSGGALGVLNPHYVGRLFSDHGCQKLLFAAIILLSSGLLVMRGMIRRILA